MAVVNRARGDGKPMIQRLIQYIRDNKEWVLSGIGPYIIGLVFTVIGFAIAGFRILKRRKSSAESPDPINVNVNIELPKDSVTALPSTPPAEIAEESQGIKVSLAKLPSTSSDLFGREEELKILDEAWENPDVFISYSQDSQEHKERVLDLSDRLRRDGIDCNIDQYETSPPEGWPKWMDRQIEKSEFVIVVCTEIYHRRVMDEEKPGTGKGVKWESILIYQDIYDADAKNIKFIPVLFDLDDAKYICKPLGGATYYCVNTDEGYEALYRRLTNQPETTKPKLGKLKKLPPRERKQGPVAVEVSLAKLPSTSSDLFGREKGLKMLDDAWEKPETDVVSLVAWGGVGKSALVNVWLNGMEKEDYRGAERVYGWSFYSQGAREGAQASADEFIDTALRWFGDPEMADSSRSPWDKGERLAGLVKKQRTLLILDGLEPLQNPPGQGVGEIRDPSLKCLLRELARQNPGLCVITTRLKVDDLKDYVGASVESVDLEKLSQEAGTQLLKNLGADGTDDELRQAVDEFDGHALALTLLGRYVAVVYKGDIRQRDKIPGLTKERKHGGHARRVMESYEEWFSGKPELDILRIMGLFDRPAEADAIEAVRIEPVIEGLTSELGKLSYDDWQFALSNLREVRLLSPEDPDRRDCLDCHPLIREHFGEQLRQEFPEAWREGNNRLYEHLKKIAKELPDTIQEMAPLFAAVLHGCQAGRHQEAMDEIYWPRIQRRDKAFIAKKLGAIGSELAALSGFFDPLWSKPVDGLTEAAKSFVLSEAGYDLRALGRLREVAEPMEAGLEIRLKRQEWLHASRFANNLSEVHLTMGEVEKALGYARQSVDYADHSGDAFWRMGSRTTLADALHQSGKLEEAQAAFIQAEEMQKERQPSYPLLYSQGGFRYCDLLLEQGEYREVLNRAGRALEWGTQEYSLLDFALDHLSLGRAHMLQAQEETGDFSQASAQLDQAVDGLRAAGTQHNLPWGLLARAELHRVMGNLDMAQHDLEQAMTIAARDGMRLHEADCHLGFARLYLAMKKKDKARESLKTAREMIDQMRYHRRDGAVEELQSQIH